MTEKAKAKPKAKVKSKAKPKAEPAKVERKAPQVQTHHTLEDICKAGREFKAAAADHVYNKQRALIQRLSAEQVEKSQANVDKLKQFAINIHEEYLQQPNIKKAFARDHLKALKNVKS